MAPIIIDWACQMNEPKCLNAAEDNFSKVRTGEFTWLNVDVNFRDLSRQYGIRNGNPLNVKYFMDQLVNLNDQPYATDFLIDSLAFLPREYEETAFEIFNFFDEDDEIFNDALYKFSKQPPMRDVVIEYITGELQQRVSEFKTYFSQNYP
jgi:hypothetical protein